MSLERIEAEWLQKWDEMKRDVEPTLGYGITLAAPFFSAKQPPARAGRY